MGYFHTKQIGKPSFNPGRRRKPGILERRAVWQRFARSYLKLKEIIPRKQPSVWTWTCGNRTGFVSAFTRSEARARIKETLGLKKNCRLPSNVTIEKIENEQTPIKSETGTSVQETRICTKFES